MIQLLLRPTARIGTEEPTRLQETASLALYAFVGLAVGLAIVAGVLAAVLL